MNLVTFVKPILKMQFTMVNTDDFIKRIENILDYYSLNASSFADKIGVQRSSLSHLLSGRNKPSLDFILKILDVFPEVDLYWLLNGKGSFPKKSESIDKKEDDIDNISKQTIPTPLNDKIIPEDLFSERQHTNTTPSLESKKTESPNYPSGYTSSEIDKIVIFYKNGTFKSYTPD